MVKKGKLKDEKQAADGEDTNSGPETVDSTGSDAQDTPQAAGSPIEYGETGFAESKSAAGSVNPIDSEKPLERSEMPDWEAEISWETWCHPNRLGRAINEFFAEVRRDLKPELHKKLIPLFINPVGRGQSGVLNIVLDAAGDFARE